MITVNNKIQKQKTAIVSFSGGAGSFVSAVRAIKKYGKENTILVFCDTTIEDHDLYRFIAESSKKLEIPLIKLKDGRTPWDVFRDKRYQGNTRTAHCTIELKGKMFRRWLDQNYTPDSCVLVFGFDWTEGHRHATAEENYKEFECWSPLLEAPYLDKTDTLNIIESYGIDIPRLYKFGFSHNNCGGFCVRAGQEHYRRLLMFLPEVYAHHEREQEQLMRDLPTAKPFLRKTIDGELRYLTLKQFREMIEAGDQHDELDFGGCGCFV